MNRKFITLLAVVLFCTSTLFSQAPKEIKPFITPFGEFNFERPEFPDRSVSIEKYGAQEGGTYKNTEAINKAIKKLATKGGGKVIIPEGKWLTGPIVLQSNINLYLEEGAEVLFSTDFEDYLPAVLTNMEGTEVYSYSPFIYAFKQKNIAITGKGTLFGQGKAWWKQRASEESKGCKQKLHDMAEEGIPVKERIFDNLDNFLAPTFFGPLYCENILVEGVEFRYGAFWTINPNYCENVIVRDINIVTEGEYGHTPNGDGVNPNSCNKVLIEYNTISTGDDCITIKSGRNKDGKRINIPCKNILIRYNTGYKGHGGVVIGSEMSGGVENVYAHDCQFYGTDRIIRIKTERGRGAYVRNCWFKDIKADSIEREAIRINMLYHGDRLPEQEVTKETPVIENLHYENISCAYAKRNIITIVGIPEMPIQNVSFKNLNIQGNKGMIIIDAKDIKMDKIALGNENGSLATISYSDNIQINEMTILGIDDEKTPIIYEDVTNSSLTNPNFSSKGKVKITGNSKNIQVDK